MCSSLRRCQPASVPHISITWNKLNRTRKSHACSAMEMRGQLSLRYQFWTDGLPWGAISPFQLKIQNSHCLKRHVKTHRWVLFASMSAWAFCWSRLIGHRRMVVVVLGGFQLEVDCKRALGFEQKKKPSWVKSRWEEASALQWLWPWGQSDTSTETAHLGVSAPSTPLSLCPCPVHPLALLTLCGIWTQPTG